MGRSLLDRLLDPTIVFAFDRTGYRRHAASFDATDLDVDLRGRTVLVTGANAGIGKETARELARRGAAVWMVCRNEGRGAAARDELASDTLVVTAGGTLHLAVCDVSDLDAVDAMVSYLPVESVDVVVHNAGALVDERTWSPQGVELTLATHLVGPLRMTALLLDRLSKSSRIVWVSSGGMYPRRLSVDRLSRREGPFDGVKAYADVKRAQVVMSEMLANRLGRRGVTSNAMHPGWAATQGVQTSLPAFYKATRAILRTPAEGADTVIWLAACPRIATECGKFWFDRAAVSPYLVPFTRESPAERDRLWSAALQWSGLADDAFGH